MSTSDGKPHRKKPSRIPKVTEVEPAKSQGQGNPGTIDAETVKKGARITGADRAKLSGT
jgi:hypothetical protein